MRRSLLSLFIFIIFTTLIISCSFPFGQPPTPTADAQMVAQTVNAVQTQSASTSIAQLTQEAVNNPTQTYTSLPTSSYTIVPFTNTPTQTSTPLPTATILPTLTFTLIPPPTRLPTVPIAVPTGPCQLISQTPKRFAQIASGSDFDANWKIKNTSGDSWETEDVDFRYISGTKMQKWHDVVYLQKSVDPEGIAKIRVDMIAPLEPGPYTSNWGLVKGGTYVFCVVSLQIQVVKN